MTPPAVTTNAGPTHAGQATTDAGIVDAKLFGSELAPSNPKLRSVRRLHAEFSRMDPQAGPLEREEMLTRLAGWLNNGGEAPALSGAPKVEPGQVRRLRLLVLALQKFPALAARTAAVVGLTLLEQRAGRFLARSGIPGDSGLFSETIDRLSRRLLPQPIDEEDLTHTLARMFPRPSDLEWLDAVPAALVVDLSRALELRERPSVDSPPHQARAVVPSFSELPLGASPSLIDAEVSGGMTTQIWAPLRNGLLDAILILASRISAAGLSDAFRARSPKHRLRESPFFQLPRHIDALLATKRRDQEAILAWNDDCRVALYECSETCRSVLDHLDQTGVSVDVVYRLELIERSIERIERLLDLVTAPNDEAQAAQAVSLLTDLLRQRRKQLSLVDIVRTNTHLLARKIIERAGHTGEHYITTTPGEYLRMLASAGGGGLLTAGTAALKFVIGKWNRPPLQEALLASVNYAGSFVLIQALGFTLATKQPSMTAAAVAAAVHKGEVARDELVTLIARVFRSQLAAALGNVGMVIPAAIALDAWWMSENGAHVITGEYGMKVLASMHPTESGTIWFATLTGVILWLSSIGAGWLENWAVYRRLPEAIAEHRLGRVLGRRMMDRLSRVFARNVAGVGGSVSLGLMLGLTYSLGQFTGIPVDVRHVTLSTGSITYAVLANGTEVMSTAAFTSSLVGIVIILFCNLGVSFLLALLVAFRAREVSLWQVLRLPIDVLVGFVVSPLRFVLPFEPKPSKPASSDS